MIAGDQFLDGMIFQQKSSSTSSIASSRKMLSSSSSSSSNKPPFFPYNNYAGSRSGAATTTTTTTRTAAITNEYNPFWLVVSHQHRIATTIIPKVMCTSIRTAINGAECQKENPRCSESRRNPRLLNELMLSLRSSASSSSSSNHYHHHNHPNHTIASKSYGEEEEEYTRVLIVRDPFERALSAYANSVTNPFIETQHCKSSAVCTFDEWVNDLPTAMGSNEHFMSQTSVAQFSDMHYHYILRLSSPVDQDFFWNGLLKNKKNAGDVVDGSTTTTAKKKANVSSKNTTGTIRDTYRALSTDTIQTLARLYSDDLKMWDSVLQHGTPRVAGEETMYDFYKAERMGNAQNGIFWQF
jgi:hypothetical protein